MGTGVQIWNRGVMNEIRCSRGGERILPRTNFFLFICNIVRIVPLVVRGTFGLKG